MPPSGSTFPLGTTTANCTATDSAGSSASCSFTVTVNLSADSPYVYFTDFENGIGAEWSSSKRVNAANFTWFSGNFGNESQTLTLTLNNLGAGKSYALDFDLYVLDSWDGVAGPDYFNVAIDGTQRFHETFSNYDGEPPVQPQTYPGSPEGGRRHLGMGVYVDAIYRKIRVQFTAGGTSAAVTFSGQNLQDLTDESWGIDNVGVRKAVEIAPVTVTVPPGGTTTFAASSGQPPYTFSIANNPTQGSIDPNTGLYTASTQCSTEDTVRVTDAGGTTADALVVVVGMLPPIITCPPNQIVEAGANCLGGCSRRAEPGDGDGRMCQVTLSQFLPLPGTLLGLGLHPITVLATDAAGNFTTCVTELRITDTTPPVINACSQSQTLTAGANCEAGLPDLTSGVVATDRCDAVTVTQNPPAGTPLGIGNHTVTFTAVDRQGNMSTCTTTVTVRDITPPVITSCAPPRFWQPERIGRRPCRMSRR